VKKVLKLLETLNTMNLINNRLRAQFNLLRSNNVQPHYNKYGPHRQCSYRYQSLQFTLLAVAVAENIGRFKHANIGHRLSTLNRSFSRDVTKNVY